MKFDSDVAGQPSIQNIMMLIQRIIDTSHGMTRVEVRCGHCDAILVMFSMTDTTVQARHCINSAAMRFEVKE